MIVHRADRIFWISLERVRVQHDHVGALAFFNRAELGVQLHGARGHDGRRLQRLQRRESGLDVQLDLAMNAVPGNPFVGTGHDRHAGIVKRFDDAQAALEAGAGRGGVDAGSAGIREQPVERRWNLRDAWLERRDRRPGGVTEQLVPRLRGIDHGLSIAQHPMILFTSSDPASPRIARCAI